MSLPLPGNTSCDVYRFGNAPPASPDVAGVAGQLSADYERRMETGESEVAAVRYTHVLLVDLQADLRSGTGSAYTAPLNGDTVYVPDKNGTPFRVVFVERKGRGTAFDHKRVYLDRRAPTWPTSNL
jgi:hypothetical protein